MMSSARLISVAESRAPCLCLRGYAHAAQGHATPAVGLWLLVLAICVACSQPAMAQQVQQSAINREYMIKSAYLYNFGRYVRWPAGSFQNAQSPLVIGVLGSNPFGNTLEIIAGQKRVEGRRIVVQNFESIDQYTRCHILFIVRSVDEEELVEVIERLSNSHVLLVGESPSFTRLGGVISFFVEQNKVRFEISVEAAKREGLKISSKLLSLAKLVENTYTQSAGVVNIQGLGASGPGAEILFRAKFKSYPPISDLPSCSYPLVSGPYL